MYPDTLLPHYSTFLKKLLDCNHSYIVNISTFNEDLYEHINLELADYVGRESDTS
jgi:hypothetical protein